MPSQKIRLQYAITNLLRSQVFSTKTKMIFDVLNSFAPWAVEERQIHIYRSPSACSVTFATFELEVCNCSNVTKFHNPPILYSTSMLENSLSVHLKYISQHPVYNGIVLRARAKIEKFLLSFMWYHYCKVKAILLRKHFQSMQYCLGHQTK